MVGGCLSLIAALLHIGVIIGGPDWYRFFGAGEGMARMDERGLWQPMLMTIGIAAVLSVWALYAFAGADRFPKLPLMRTALVLISGIYLARGLLIVPIMIEPHARTAFNIWSSLIVLVYGLVHAVGTWLVWPALKPKPILSQKEAL
ncbi:hypothetical protein [Sphingomonas sp. 37zxx]|uniref:hypothetical protein n=1 Tax=Sphingomonas sp. 37zxx TaxID=1550073 RepID=UPI00068F83D1|nr:hypothetical protein [Sphingomonas sp. 37zxx]